MSDTEAHSSLIGGSTAARRLACPASYQMENKLPKAIREASSSYADEGTALHEAMAFILRENLVSDELEDHVLGREFAGYVMTREMMDEAIYPCVDFLDALMDELNAAGEPDVDLLIEQRCEVPGIPSAFGTADVIFRTAKRSGIIDWKFGVGVPVYARMEEADGTIKVNAQLQFYARGAKHSYPHMFGEGDDWPVDLYIAQPRVRTGAYFGKAQVTVKELEAFRWSLVSAVAEATGDAPRMARGDHCRFASCKSICPKFTGPLLDLTKITKAVEAKKQNVIGGIDIDWAAMYGELLTLGGMAEMIIREIRAQAHAFMSDGNPIPGYKLVAKRADAKYIDDSHKMQAANKAKEVGCFTSEIMTYPEVRSPAQLRDAMAAHLPHPTKKGRQEKAAEIIAEFTHKVSSGTTIAPEDDTRDSVIPTSGQLLALSTKLAALAQQ